jgi:formiminoglutamase
MSIIDVIKGTSPIILAFPHGGIDMPSMVHDNLNDNGRHLSDTDWHIRRLYDGLLDNATYVEAKFHRYIIDANRDPDDVSLYPGQNTTGLCPLSDFDGKAIWKSGYTLDVHETSARRVAFHGIYHTALQDEIDRIKSIYGGAVLYDCHSIRCEIPFLFDGKLPDFNIGTNNSNSCAAEFEQSVLDDCKAATAYKHVVNGRFKGGWTTRHYGKPENNIHAIQMELNLGAYADETAPWAYDDKKAIRLRPILKTILTNLDRLARQKLHEGILT